MESDEAYFRGRAEEETEAAMKAECIAARKVHLELSKRYGELADAIAGHKNSLFARDALEAR